MEGIIESYSLERDIAKQDMIIQKNKDESTSYKEFKKKCEDHFIISNEEVFKRHFWDTDNKKVIITTAKNVFGNRYEEYFD